MHAILGRTTPSKSDLALVVEKKKGNTTVIPMAALLRACVCRAQTGKKPARVMLLRTFGVQSSLCHVALTRLGIRIFQDLTRTQTKPLMMERLAPGCAKKSLAYRAEAKCLACRRDRLGSEYQARKLEGA